MAHIPYIYSDAHKFHHFMHFSSPFDCHIYDTGAPEELCALHFELFLCYFFGLFPPCLSYSTLYQIYYNKIGHSRPDKFNLPETKFHADHHLLITKNFSWNIAVDLFLNTSKDSDSMLCNEYLISKKICEKNELIILSYKKL
jgi:hypothetical protein